MDVIKTISELSSRLQTLRSEDAATLYQWLETGGFDELRIDLERYLKQLLHGPPIPIETSSLTHSIDEGMGRLGVPFPKVDEVPRGTSSSKECHAIRPCVEDVVNSHDQAFGDYLWLWPKYGRLLWVDFEEPAESGIWRTYDRYYWVRHACVVDHTPDQLYEEHVREYVNPETKKINLLFWFERPDGSVYSIAPTEDFYRLEAEYFQHQQLCTPKMPAAHQDQIGPESLHPKYKGGHH